MSEIIVGSSRFLVWVLVLAHVAGGALLAVTGLPWAWKIAALPLFLGSLMHSLRRHAWRVSPTAVVGLQLDPEGKALFRHRNGQVLEGCLLGSSFVSPWLTVLNLRPVGGRCSVPLVILPDAAGEEDFRRLRVWLRWKYSQAKLGW